MAGVLQPSCHPCHQRPFWFREGNFMKDEGVIKQIVSGEKSWRSFWKSWRRIERINSLCPNWPWSVSNGPRLVRNGPRSILNWRAQVFGEGRKERWQESCHPVQSEVLTVKQPVAGVQGNQANPLIDAKKGAIQPNSSLLHIIHPSFLPSWNFSESLPQLYPPSDYK